jgi:serine/threonine protein kinase
LQADPRLEGIARAICAARGLTFVREVGAGAFKRTYHVQQADGSSRALKVYRKAGADARTQREVDAIRRCDHPGVVKFEAIETWRDGNEDFVYSLEEFLSGGTLTTRLQSGPMAIPDVKSLAIGLADAVGHVASLELVHRDLKPDNVMFRTKGGQPVIVDFGLVRDLQQMSLTNTWQPQGPGTPFFAPAEQLNNEKPMIDWRADQFSLGILLAMAARGQHPYARPGDDPLRTVERVARREQVSQEFLTWANSVGLAMVAKMVAPWPIERYRTPVQLQQAWGGPGGVV